MYYTKDNLIVPYTNLKKQRFWSIFRTFQFWRVE